MAGPSDPLRPRRRWWARRGPDAPIAMTRICPSCNTAGPVRLLAEQVCAACEAQAAWAQLGDAPLVIDRASIAAAVRRRQGEAAGVPVWRRLLILVAPTLTLGVAAIAAWCLVQVMSARAIGPLGALLEAWTSAARAATGLGLAAVILGVVALRRARRTRQFRRLAILGSHLLAIAVGGTALVIGGAHWLALGGGGGMRYTSMPPREPLGVPSQVERILDATAVVLAPDADGDVRELAIGTGAVIARDDARAWIVTCSHVAMPYVAVGTWRRARDAQPVWVQLADGREGKARVRWTAPPPIDVVVLELPIEHAPEPVPIAADSADVQASTSVTFVPNPYRTGWGVRHGELIRREPHRTPAGTYDLLFTDLPVIPGDSGSGLYDARGRLVGLNTWTQLGVGASQGISLPAETMRVLGDAIRSGQLDNLEEAARPAPRR